MESERDLTLFFGSSPINTFSLAREEKFRITRFTGATAKGLGQENNNSRMIWNIVTNKYARETPEAIIWMFGTIDCKFSYYYKLCTEPTIPCPTATMVDCATKYVSFVLKVHDLFKAKGTKTIIIGAEPNAAPPNKAYAQCLHYFIIPDTPENRRKVSDSVQHTHPEQLRQVYNNTLKRLCAEHGLEFVSIDDKLIDPHMTDLNTSIVKREYVDVLDVCVHLNWEANLLFYQEKLKERGFLIETTFDLAQSRAEYLKDKNERIQKIRRTYACRGIDSEPANHKRHKEVEQEIAQQPQKKMKFINFVQQTKGV